LHWLRQEGQLLFLSKLSEKMDNFAVIDNVEDYKDGGVSLYSSYIINPKNIEEGQVIN